MNMVTAPAMVAVRNFLESIKNLPLFSVTWTIPRRRARWEAGLRGGAPAVRRPGGVRDGGKEVQQLRSSDYKLEE